MGSGEHRYTIADAQEFVRRGMAAQKDVDEIINKETKAGTVVPSNREKDVSARTGADGATGIRSRKQPNKTEAEFGRILEAMKQRGEICDYFYEGLTLHWGKGMRYTPDYVVYDENQTLPLLIEIKGGHIWSRDAVRFKGCRAEWGKFYRFEMHQKKGGIWTRIQ